MTNDDHGKGLNSGTEDKGKTVKGEVKEMLGAVTGDRRVEAEGRVAQRVADPEAPEREESDEAVQKEERSVRGVHNDVPDDGGGDEGPLGT